MSWGKKKIAAASTFLMGAFMLAAGGIAGAQEIKPTEWEPGRTPPSAESCKGIIDTRGKVEECYGYLQEQEADYMADIKEVAGDNKKLLGLGDGGYYAFDECRDHTFAGLAIGMGMIDGVAKGSDGQEPVGERLYSNAKEYFSAGEVCMKKGADILEQHDSTKKFAEGYRQLGNEMGRASKNLPQPKP